MISDDDEEIKLARLTRVILALQERIDYLNSALEVKAEIWPPQEEEANNRRIAELESLLAASRHNEADLEEVVSDLKSQVEIEKGFIEAKNAEIKRLVDIKEADKKYTYQLERKCREQEEVLHARVKVSHWEMMKPESRTVRLDGQHLVAVESGNIRFVSPQYDMNHPASLDACYKFIAGRLGDVSFQRCRECDNCVCRCNL